MSSYHFSKIVDMTFDEAVASTKQALGACNPQLTFKALQAEDKVGTMLPCNVVVQEKQDGEVEVSAVDPVESLQPINHIVIDQLAHEIRAHLQNVINEVGQTNARKINAAAD
jgi:uncharacterized protein (DUF302 family)